MIVNRMVVMANKGHLDDALNLLKAEMNRLWPSRHVRYYRSNLAPLDAFAAETEFESLAEYERVMTELWPRISVEFWEKWNQFTQVGGTSEIWDLV